MAKCDVLKALKKSSGNYVSGEAISDQLHLTRAAIWKSIKSLRKTGYIIEARSGCGYRLVEVPDVLSASEITSFLEGRTEPIICLDSIDSTNNYLKRAALENATDQTVVIANCQTAGRGRMNRSFQSPDKKGIYLSYLMRPKVTPAAMLPITALCAVSMCNAVEAVCGTRPQIKWVNDLVLHGKKICGILTEMAIEGESGSLQYAIIGVGINIHQKKEDFHDGVAQMASSLTAELGCTISSAQLAAEMTKELDALYHNIGNDYQPYLAAYRKDCITLNKEIEVICGDMREKAYAMDVNEQFGLMIRDKNGKARTVNSGEISVRGLYGYTD